MEFFHRECGIVLFRPQWKTTLEILDLTACQKHTHSWIIFRRNFASYKTFSGQKGKPLLSRDNLLVSGPRTRLSEFKCCAPILIMTLSLRDYRFVPYYCFLPSVAGKADELPGPSGQCSSSVAPLFQQILFISNFYNFRNILYLDPFHAENES